MNVCVTPGLAKSELLSEVVMYLVRVTVVMHKIVLYLNHHYVMSLLEGYHAN